ncbi:DUF2789 domain-containing protein [Aestuariirhabdus sp. Z084]|uniref:DUF2789 domain-containing protein n=1 Tax=Aestuariirhabdus haliotis TaxID=2918751 RepID=UPI00201B36D0|nr:DUF2789 domain-containing protein [Aestuariirhabdus haliotis]MCL6416200.1 DUF2789 domain-containing protein [Aestuariirhabdus haliotis]MCL6420252.1 DUF2789 domain-containing protein [Aestuariirhabdus haliotis]
MDRSEHSLYTLFEQLGLAGTDQEIDDFVEQFGPVDAKMALADAPFWTEAQAQFLREAIESDGDWAELVDELDTLMRK